MNGIYIGLYINIWIGLDKGWEVLWSQLTHKEWIELQLYEKVFTDED